MDRSIWTSVFVGYVALLTHRVNELIQFSPLYAQLSAVVIAYIALYSVIRAKRHVQMNAAFSHLIVQLAEIVKAPRPQVAEQLAARIVELKTQVQTLEAEAADIGLATPFKEKLAHSLARHFVSSREKLESISAQLQLYKDVADASPIPMVITDLRGNLTYANPAHLRLLGGCLHDVLGQGWQHYASPESLPAVNAHWFGEVQRESSHIDGRITYLIDGVPVECVYNMTRISDGYCGFVIPVNK